VLLRLLKIVRGIEILTLSDQWNYDLNDELRINLFLKLQWYILGFFEVKIGQQPRCFFSLTIFQVIKHPESIYFAQPDRTRQGKDTLQREDTGNSMENRA